jgi:flagellar motor switch protein FliM
MHGSIITQISPEFAYMIISRLFGGEKAGDNSKQFTEIELALIERVLRQAASIFDEAWDKVISLSAQIDRIETSPQFAQITAPNEPVAVIILNVKMGEEQGIMSVCIPNTATQPVSQQLNTRLWYSSGTMDDARKEETVAYLQGKLLQTPINVTALFEQTPATVTDIVNLQIGDVIKLDHAVDQPITIKVHHIPKFKASIGTLGHKYALQIVDVIKEELQNEYISR